jgi:hypothetical protein
VCCLVLTAGNTPGDFHRMGMQVVQQALQVALAMLWQSVFLIPGGSALSPVLLGVEIAVSGSIALTAFHREIPCSQGSSCLM